MFKKVRKYITWLIILMILFVVVSCNDAPASLPADDSNGELVEVTIWTAYGDQLQGAVDAYNAKLQEEGKNVKVTPVELGLDSISDKFAVSMTTGDVPDILDLDLVLAPGFTSVGALLDITEWVEEEGLIDDFNPKFLDLGMWDEKIYMIPFSADVSAIYYNKDHFAESGLDPEMQITTWEEFLDAATAIKDAGLKSESGLDVKPFAGAWHPGAKMFCDMPFVWTNGGGWLDENGEVIFDSPETISGMKWLTDIYLSEDMVPPNITSYEWDNKMNSFYNGEVSIVCSGSYAMAEMKELAPDLNYGLFLFPHPEGKGEQTSFIGGNLIGIPKDSKHPEEAWEFIKYTMTEAVQVDVWAKDGMPPVRESMANNPYFEEEPLYYTFTEGVRLGYVPKSIHYNEFYEPWGTAWDEIVLGEKPLEQILQEQAEVMRQIVSR